MKKKTKEIEKLNIEGMSKFFEVVSKVKFDGDNDFYPYLEDDDGEDKDVLETFFEEEIVSDIYYLEDHEIDFDLAIRLSLGVLKNKETGKLFLYYTSTIEDEELRQDGELLMLAMYYQITHPDYIDTDLERVVKEDERFVLLHFYIAEYEPMKRLKDVFKAQKGGDNVISFK